MSPSMAASARHYFELEPSRVTTVPALDPTPAPRPVKLKAPLTPVPRVEEPEPEAIERITAEQRRILTLLW